MTKEEHIQYWIKSAEDDWNAVHSLFTTSNFVQCLFFAHLVLEKIFKAHWVKANPENTPPRTHNLVALAIKTELLLSDTELQFLEEFNDFQLEGRYPDYQFKINQRCTFEFTETLLAKVNQTRIWLLEKM